jgi:potassium-dependent mechanosensitive channel
MRLPSNLFHQLLLLAFLLSWAGGAVGQSPSDAPVPAPPTVTTHELLDLRAQLHEGGERVAPLVEAIDTGPAVEWLGSSPLERLAERVDATAQDVPEHGLWQSAAEQEQAGQERIRGALDRAALALASDERLEEAERRVREILAARVDPPTDDEDRTLTRIEQEMAALERRRTQVSLDQDQKRQTLERLEGQARTQEEIMERLRQERVADLETRPWGPLQEPSLVLAFEAWEAARERRADARIISAQLDNQTRAPRIETLRLELAALEAEVRWLAQSQRQLAAELTERSGEELRALREEVRRLTEREPEAAERFASEIPLLLQRIDRIAETQARVSSLQADRERYAQIEADLTQTLASIRERLEIGGLTDVLGGLLLEEERRLRGLLDLRFVLRDVERELAQSRLRYITLRDELRNLPPAPPGLSTTRPRRTPSPAASGDRDPAEYR